MRGHFVRLAKQTLVYGIGAVAQQILGLITLPIYARVFDPAEYGVIEVITVGLAVLSIAVDLGLASAAQRSYFDYSDSQVEERRVVLSSAIGPSMAIAVLLAAVIVIAQEPISVWLFGTGSDATAVALAGLCIPAITLATLLREVMRLRFAPWRYLGSSLIAGGLGAMLSVLFVLAFNMGINGVFAGTLAGNAAAAVYGLIVAFPHLGRRISSRELRVMFAYGLPLIPSAFAMWALQFVDRVMLTKLASLSEVGQYAISNRLALVLLFVVSAFGIAYAPFMLAMHAEDEEVERRFRGRLLTYVTAALVVIAVILSLFAREIIAVVAPGFDTAYQSVALVCAGMVALGVSQVAMSGIALKRRTMLFAVYATAAAVVNVVLNIILIPPWGQVGAGVATAVAYILLAILYYRGAQRVYHTQYEPAKIIAVCGLGAALMPIGLIGPDVLWLDIAAKLAAIVALVVGLRLIGVVGPAEFAELNAAVRGWRGDVPVSA